MKDDIVPPNPTPESSTQNINDVVVNPAGPAQQQTPAAEAPAPSQNETSAVPSESGDQPNNKSPVQNQQDPNQPKKKHGNGLVISLAVFVMLTLAGLAAYIGFFADNSSDTSKDSASQTSQTAAEDKQAVDQLAAEAESLPEDQDESGNGLSDDQLGL